MRKIVWALVLAGGCATASTGTRVASNDPMAFNVPPSAECQSVRTKHRGFVAAALGSLGAAAGTGVAAAVESSDHTARIGLGATAITTGAVALATGLAAWSYDARAQRCSQ